MYVERNTGVFGCCSKMFYKGFPLAVKAIHSPTEEKVKREARIMSKLYTLISLFYWEFAHFRNVIF